MFLLPTPSPRQNPRNRRKINSHEFHRKIFQPSSSLDTLGLTSSNFRDEFTKKCKELRKCDLEKIQTIPSAVKDLNRIIQQSEFNTAIFIHNMKKLNLRLKDATLQRQIYVMTTVLQLTSLLRGDMTISNQDFQLIFPTFQKAIDSTLVNLNARFVSFLNETNQDKQQLKSECLKLLIEINEIGKGNFLSKIVTSVLNCFVLTFPPSIILEVAVHFGIKKSQLDEFRQNPKSCSFFILVANFFT